MRFDNAREAEQLERMRELRRQGKCFFCDSNYLAIGAPDAKLYLRHWFVRDNDYPYPGTVRHVTIIPYRHVKNLRELTPEEWSELLHAIKRVEENYELHDKGESIFARSGDMAYTGATIDHLHFHLLVGGPKPDDWKSIQEDNIIVTLGHKARS